jgi:dUTPase
MIKVTNDSVVPTTLHLEIGDRFSQGIFEQFGICVDDNVDTKRTGGMGSTGN